MFGDGGLWRKAFGCKPNVCWWRLANANLRRTFISAVVDSFGAVELYGVVALEKI
jgi:hypothetical protein